ncbi:MAG TPA: VWA domain-containing protein, partial [bacterium]|nr:VWA domain-containing protein [bacterium]
DEERQLNLVLMIDASSSAFFSTAQKSKLEIAAELSGILAFSALQNNDKVGVIIFSDIIEKYLPPKTGKKNSLRIIREMLTFTPKNCQTNISKALEFAIKTFKRKSVIFLISDFFDKNYEKNLALLSKKHDLTNVIITDIRDLILENCGIINFRDIETGEDIYLDTTDKKILEEFKDCNKRRLENIERTFAKYNADIIKLNSEKSYIDSLIAYFKKRIRQINRNH